MSTNEWSTRDMRRGRWKLLAVARNHSTLKRIRQIEPNWTHLTAMVVNHNSQPWLLYCHGTFGREKVEI